MSPATLQTHHQSQSPLHPVTLSMNPTSIQPSTSDTVPRCTSADSSPHNNPHPLTANPSDKSPSLHPNRPVSSLPYSQYHMTTSQRVQHPPSTDLPNNTSASTTPNTAGEVATFINSTVTPVPTELHSTVDNVPIVSITANRPRDDALGQMRTNIQLRLAQQRKFLNNFRDLDFQHIIPYLRDAINALSTE